jgi:effector-binding domain-containing protein
VPELVELSPQPAVVVACRVPFSRIGEELSRILPLLLSQIRESGGCAAGPPFTRYLGFAGEEGVEIQAGFPVLEPVHCGAPSDFILLPGGETVTLAHYGPPESLPSSHAALDEWLESSGRQPAGPRWEVYVTGPAAERDPARWLTRLFQPLLPR